MLVAITCGIGLARLLRERKLLSKKSTFTQDYIEHLTTYIGSFGNHYESYNWLVHRMDKMQNQMGADGICALYQPPHTPTQYLNYAIILNTLPNLRNALRESNNSNIYHHSNSLIDALIRHQGTLHDLGELNNKSLRNPVIWLREGVRAITASPLTLLGWLGVLSEATVSRLASGRLFLGISAFGGLVAFISAVMRIVLGWEAFTQKVSAWWPW
jgi:hypothetical protein